jgi:uncharacterized protein
MIRVVLDTNVVVSAHIQPLGPPARILLAALAKEFELCVSSDILAEYDEVLRRPKFKIEPAVVNAFLEAAATAVFVTPTTRIQAARDQDDNKFLECAFEGRANYIVTGNLNDYPEDEAWLRSSVGNPLERHIRIVSPREFLNILDKL